MNFKKKVLFAISSLCVFLSIFLVSGNALAYDYVNGNSYQYFEHKNIPGGGLSSYNRTKASRKTDTSSNPLRLGTFLSDYNSAWLGNYAALADYNRGGLSEEVSIPQGSKVYFTETTSVKNNTDCFSRVESHKFEPNNNNVVKLNFSANKK